MGYLDTAKRTTRRRAAGTSTLNAPVIERRRRYETNELNAISAELPLLDAGAGSPALRLRVLQLGEVAGYPALSLGRYRFRKRTVNAGLIAGRGWWQHQLAYFGDGLLAEAIRQLEVTA